MGQKASRRIDDNNVKRSNSISKRASLRSRLKLPALTRGPFAPIKVTVPVNGNKFDRYSTIGRVNISSPPPITDIYHEFIPASGLDSRFMQCDRVGEATDDTTCDTGVVSPKTGDEARVTIRVIESGYDSGSRQSEFCSEQQNLIKEAGDGATDENQVVLPSTNTSTACWKNKPALDADVSDAAVDEVVGPTCENNSIYPLLIDNTELGSSPASIVYESMSQHYASMHNNRGRPYDDSDGYQIVYGADCYVAETKLTVNKTPPIPTAAVQGQRDLAAGNDANTGIDRYANETHHLQQQQHDTVDHDIPSYNSSNRRSYVRIPLDSCSIYTWNFLSVTTFCAGDVDSDTDSVPSITVECSTNQEDFPPLADGCSLLHGSVVHFLPHNQTFTEPIFVSIEIPSTVPTSRLSSLSVYYSPTCLGERPTWRPFRSNQQTVDGVFRFEEEQEVTSGDRQPRARNAALVSTERHEVLLSLRHFCIFAIVVDGREEIVQTASVIGFLKIQPSGSASPFVDILLLLGCNETAMAKNEKLAIHDQGYTKVQNETMHIYDREGSIHVSLDSVDGIDEPIISGPHPMVHRKIEVWNESTKTRLRIRQPRAHMEQNGFCSNFFATFTIRQDGKEPMHVTIEKDLHKLMPPNSDSLQAPRLPFCRCQNCLQPHSNSSYRRKGEPVAKVAIGRMIPQNQRDRNQGAAAAADANTSSTNGDNTNEMTSFQISLRTVHPSLDNESQGQNCQQLPGNSSYMYRKAEQVAEAAVGRMTSQYQPDRNQQAATAANASSINDNNTDDSFQISLRSEHPAPDNEKAEGASHSPRNLTDSHLSSSEYAKATYIPTHHDSRLPKQNRQQMNDGVQQHQMMQQQKDKRGVDDEEHCHLSVEETMPVARDGLQQRETLRNIFNWCS